MQTFRFFQNTGGLNLRANDVLAAPEEAEDIVNMHVGVNGTWTTKDIGYVALTDSPLESGATLRGMYEFQPLSGESQLIVAAGGKLFSAPPNSVSFTELASGFSTTAAVRFVTFQGLLIACNGVDAPQKYTGTGSAEPLDGWPPVIPGVTPGMPSMAAVFANRLVFSGDADNPSMVYLSALESPEDFTPTTGATSAGAIQIAPGDGERITALHTLYLPLENEEVLVIFKERSTYLLTGHDAETFAVHKVSDEFGAVSPHSVVQVGNELMFLTTEGVTTLSTATLQGNMTSGFASAKVHPVIRQLNRDKLSESFAVHLRERQEVWWFVAEGSYQQNQRVLVLSYAGTPAWSRRSGITASCACLTTQGLLLTGGYDGHLSQQLRGNTYDGEAIDWLYRTPFYDFSAPHLRKRIREVTLYLKQISALNVTVKAFWDIRRGSSQQEVHTLSVQPDAASSVFGVAVYGADFYAIIGSSLLKFTPSGSGKFLQLEFSGSHAGQPVEIEGWTVTTIQGGLR